MAVPWHKYAALYKVQRIEDTSDYTIFESDDRVKLHNIAVFYSEVGKVAPSTMAVTLKDADDAIIEILETGSLFSVTGTPIPYILDNGLVISVTTTGVVALDLVVTYTPAAS